MDASIFRDFGIHGRVKFQFCGEATNVFNFVNLSAPSSALNSTTFGIITAAGTMRNLQVGGQLLF